MSGTKMYSWWDEELTDDEDVFMGVVGVQGEYYGDLSIKDHNTGEIRRFELRISMTPEINWSPL
jgi:hypothetical protein